MGKTTAHEVTERVSDQTVRALSVLTGEDVESMRGVSIDIEIGRTVFVISIDSEGNVDVKRHNIEDINLNEESQIAASA